MRSFAVALMCSGCTASAPPKTYEPAAPPPVVQPVVVPVTAPTTAPEPRDVLGWVRVRYGENARIKGTIASMTVEPFPPANELPNMVTWKVAATDGQQPERVTIEMPKGLPLPFVVGTEVTFAMSFAGGGPNRMGKLLVADKQGKLLMAVNTTPSGWDYDYGTKRKTEKQSGYNETTFDVKLKLPDGASMTLGEDWKAVDIGGVRFYGNGSAVKRSPLHQRQPAVPDYVGGWIDFALIRVPSN